MVHRRPKGGLGLVARERLGAAPLAGQRRLDLPCSHGGRPDRGREWDAAELLLISGRQGPDELGHILADIRRDDLRASDVIARLRTLLAKQAIARQPFELNAAVGDGCDG